MHTRFQKLLIFAICLGLAVSGVSQRNRAIAPPQSLDDRTYWVDLLYKTAEPVLRNMSKGELRKNMVVEYSPRWDGRNKDVVYMEAFARLLAGVAPWLALPDDDTPEGKQRKQMREWTLESLKNAVDPDNPDYLLWSGHHQILVDASYLANSFIRAPEALWKPLDQLTKERYIERFKSLRTIRPAYNNWLLFRAMIEVFLASIDEEYDGYALEIAIRKINEWYVGDGWYSDGPGFSLDYYNGFVIHSMLVEIVEVMEAKRIRPAVSRDLALRRMERYNRLLERLISPEATFPVIGRSVTYRMGAFQPLALAAWKYEMPKGVSEGQLRNALTSVMKRMFSSGIDNFCKEGYLVLGFMGHHPDLADFYTNNGSLYITSLVFLPLGLPANHTFWTSAPEDWTSRRAWEGKPVPRDYYEGIFQ